MEPRAATGGHNLDLMHLPDGNIEELHYLHWMGIVALHSTAAAFFCLGNAERNVSLIAEDMLVAPSANTAY